MTPDAEPAARVPTYTAEQVRIAESPLLAAGHPLMARAAAALARVVREALDVEDAPVWHLPPDGDAGGYSTGQSTAHARTLLVLAGKGSNGGDALYAAALLADEIDVDVLAVGSRVHEAGFSAAIAAGARRVEIPAVRDAAEDYDVVLDGILGIGAGADPALHGNAREAVRALMPAVEAGRSRVIAVDLPSGLHPDTGEAGDDVLPARATVTFGGVKAGLVRGRGPELSGRLILADIGLEPELEGFEPVGVADVARLLPMAR